MSTSPATRRRRARRGEGDLLRLEILDAAEQLLLERGDQDAVSVRAVARRVGCTPPSLYLHFDDKSSLIFSVCERLFTRLDEAVRAAVDGDGGALDRLKACGLAYGRFGLERPEAYRVLFMRHADAAPEDWDVDRLIGASGFALLVDLVQEAMDAGAIAAGDALVVACGAWAVVHGVVSLRISEPEFPWPVDAEAQLEHVIDTWLAGLAITS